MEVFIIAIIIGLIPAFIAKSKGRSFGLWWFYGAAIFIVALPHALLMKPDNAYIEKQQTAQGMKKCPYCAEYIKSEAVKCRYCGGILNKAAMTSDSQQLSFKDTSINDQQHPYSMCPMCKNDLIYDASDPNDSYWWCPNCQKKIVN